MAMTAREFTEKYPDRTQPVPAEYAGQWIAWDEKRKRIVAHGSGMSQVRRDAIASGHGDPVLQKVPRGPFVGSA